jgi:ribose transport system substrate-binding protein
MATIRDIARIAQVSTSTVSHVVNKTRYVSPELVERVEQAINKLDHLPNFVVKKTKNIPASIEGKYILFLISNKRNYFQHQVERQVELKLKHSGYTLLSVSLSEHSVSSKACFDHILEESIFSGIIAFLDEEKLIEKHLLNDHSLPTIVLGNECQDYKVDSICSDTLDGAYKATRHLIQNGHEHIAFIGQEQEQQSKMLQGFQKAFADYQIPCPEEFIFTNLMEKEKIFKTLDHLLSGNNTPTAIFATNFSLIMPILKYIHAHNISCPNDISIICFNDFEWAPLLNPAITTVEQRTEEFADNAVKGLLERIKNNEPANSPALSNQYKTILLSTKLNVRDSTRGIGRGPFGEKAESPNTLSLSEEDMETIRGKNLTAAISFHYAGKAWMELHLKGIKEVFDNLNISLIATTDAHFNPSLQCRQLDSLRTLEPDIIIAIPTDNQVTSEAFLRIAKSNSKLIFISNVPNGLTPNDYITCVSVNERSHGRNMGHGLGEYMLHHNLTKLGLVAYDANFYATRQRDAAAEQVITEEYPELYICGKILFQSEEEIYNKTISFINRYPEVEALYISWDGPASKVMAALTELSRTDIIISTGDLDHADALNMAKGGMIKMISAQCPYEQGQTIATAAAYAMLNKKTPSFIGIEPISVTPANLLKSWQKVFKEMPGEELRKAFLENPDYLFIKDF